MEQSHFFWILLLSLQLAGTLCFFQEPYEAPVFISSEGSTGNATIGNDDCSADVSLWNLHIADFKVGVVVQGDKIPLFDNFTLPTLGIAIVRLYRSNFSDDTKLDFIVEGIEGNLSLRPFEVLIREELSNLTISTGDQVFISGKQVDVHAKVLYGQGVNFTFKVTNDKHAPVYHKSVTPLTGIKEASFSGILLSATPLTKYRIEVTAVSVRNETLTSVIERTSAFALPQFDIVLTPEELRTNTTSMAVVTDEQITATLTFEANFTESLTGTVVCQSDTNNGWAVFPMNVSFEVNPPRASQTLAFNTTGVNNITFSCRSTANGLSHEKDVTIVVRSITHFFTVRPDNPIFAMDDEAYKFRPEGRLKIWYENLYKGSAYKDVELHVHFPSLFNNDRTIYPNQKGEEWAGLYYNKRGNFVMTATFYEKSDPDTKNVIRLNVTSGVLDVTFHPEFSFKLNKSEHLELKIWKNAPEDLDLTIKYSLSDQENLKMNASSMVVKKAFTDIGVYKITVETNYHGGYERFALKEIEVLGAPGMTTLGTPKPEVITVEPGLWSHSSDVPTTNPPVAINNDLFEMKYRNENFPLPCSLSNIPTIAARSPVKSDKSYIFSFHWQLRKKITSTWSEIVILQPNAINLVLQNFITTPGYYKIELKIGILELNATVGDFMYADVKKESIVAVIRGGSLQKVASQGMIYLDATLSYDPADKNISLSGSGEIHDDSSSKSIIYEWVCFELPSPEKINKYTTPFSQDTSYRSYPACSAMLNSVNKVMLTLQASKFFAESWVLFELTVRKDLRVSWTTQAVHVVSTQQPTINVICIWNCGPKLVTGDRTVLQAEVLCPSCEDIGRKMAEAQYKWSLYEIDLATGQQTSIPTSKWPEEINSDETSKTFDSHGGWWAEARAYKVKVDVGIEPWPMGSGEMTLYTNLPPYGGTCGVEPQSGVAGETDFVFTASDWKDEGSRPRRDPLLDLNPALTYLFYQRASIQTPFIYNGGEISTPSKKLVACGTPTNECDVILHVIDPYKGIAECIMKVTVTEYVDLAKVETTEKLDEAHDVIDTLSLQMNDTVKKQDPVKIAQDAATYSTILKSMSNSIETEEQFTKIDVPNLDSKDGLPGLLDVNTAKDPLKDTLAETGDKLILETNDAVNEAIRRNGIQDARHVEVFTKSLTSSMQSGEKYATGPTISDAAGSVKNLSVILTDGMTSAKVVSDIDSALNSFGEFMNTIVNVMAIDAASLEPNPEQIGTNTGLTDTEIDYSANLLSKRRKFKVQSRIDEAPIIVQDSREIWKSMFEVTKDLQDFKGSYALSKGNFQMALQKTNRKNILEASKSDGQTEDVISFKVEDVEINEDYDDVHFQVVKTKNIFSHGKNSKYITSDIIIASLETRDRKLSMIGPSVRHVVPDNCETDEALELITPTFIDGDAAQLFYHQFELSNPHAKVCLKLRPTNDVIVYRLYAKVGSEPNDLSYDYSVVISRRLTAVCEEVCIPAGKLKGTGRTYIGLRPFIYETQRTRRKKRSVETRGSRRKKRSATQVTSDPLVSPYKLGITVVACYSWDDDEVDWIASKCVMSRNGSDVTCRCDMSKELISGLYFKTVPNRIHFATVFSKFDVENQAAVLSTLIGIYLLFALLALWAHYMDRRSILKWGVFPLQDNYAEDEYFYLITVHTGLRKGAGTMSNIGFSLCGELEETGVRTLTDGVREGMPTGSVVHLVMAVPGDLGPLQYIRIWHDNSGAGGGGSWYLDNMVVVDLQNGESFHFFNQRWLRPEDNTLDVIVVVSHVDEVKLFRRTFFSTATKQVTDDHIWLSVFIRPDRSRFNRLERVGCCLAFLLLSMIASAMFYRGAKDIDREQGEPDLQIGALRMSWQQIYYSLVAAAITSVPIFLIVNIFRRARFRVEERFASSTCGCRHRSTKTHYSDVKCPDDKHKDKRETRFRGLYKSLKVNFIKVKGYEENECNKLRSNNDNIDKPENLTDLGIVAGNDNASQKSIVENDFPRKNSLGNDTLQHQSIVGNELLQKNSTPNDPAQHQGIAGNDLLRKNSILNDPTQHQSNVGNDLLQKNSLATDHPRQQSIVGNYLTKLKQGIQDSVQESVLDKVEKGTKASVAEESQTEEKLDAVGENQKCEIAESAESPIELDYEEDSANTFLNSCCARAPWMVTLEKEIQKLNKILLIRPAGIQSLDGSWPFVTRCVAWVTVITCVLVCSFFVVLYSMEWGKDVTEEWLSTFFLTFLQSLVVVDPTKVVFITFLFTIFIRKIEFVGSREINMKIVSEVNKEYGLKVKPNPARKYVTFDTALKVEDLREVTLKRKVRVLVRHTLLELAIHGVLLVLVCSLCYSNRTTLDYRMQENVHNSLIGPKYKGFKYVNSTKMYYDWLENVVTPWLFPEKNYKGESILSEDRYFTADWALYRLGAPRLRQVRMPWTDCPTNKIKSLPCVDSYSVDEEVTAEHCFGWRLPIPCPPIDQLRLTAGSWYFRSPFDLSSVPVSGHHSTYGGGGYVTNLDINIIVANAILKETKNSFWIDRQTRAVFLEFTLYCPNTDHFISIILLAEFIPGGGVVTYYSAYPFSPYPPRGALGQYISVCEIAAILFTAIGFVYVIHEFKVHRKAALCNFWFMVDVLVFVMATTAISMYSMRLTSLKTALTEMRDDPRKFVNFNTVVIWDIGFMSCLGFLIALTSFRLLKLAGYSKKTIRVYHVLRLSLGILPSFMTAIWIILTSFAISGYILFHSTSPFYKNYFDSVFTLFLGVLGKTGFKNTGLPPAGFHITFFYIILFGCIINIFLANWFIAVMLEILTVNAQRDCSAVRSENAKVFQLLWISFLSLFKKNKNF